MSATDSRGKARIGVLVPFTNINLEADLAMMRPQGVSFHFARLGGYDADEIPDAKQMSDLGKSDIDASLDLLMGVDPDVVMYGCTSATLTHGVEFDNALSRQIKLRSGASTVTAASSLVHAIKKIGATRIGFASPYVHEINQAAVAFLSDCGIHTVAQADVSTPLDNYGQRELHPDKVFALGERANHEEAEAIVLSCTDMRSVEVIERLEDKLGKPVVTSNQAMMAQAVEELGIDLGHSGFGMLFEKLKMP